MSNITAEDVKCMKEVLQSCKPASISPSMQTDVSLDKAQDLPSSVSVM